MTILALLRKAVNISIMIQLIFTTKYKTICIQIHKNFYTRFILPWTCGALYAGWPRYSKSASLFFRHVRHTLISFRPTTASRRFGSGRIVILHSKEPGYKLLSPVRTDDEASSVTSRFRSIGFVPFGGLPRRGVVVVVVIAAVAVESAWYPGVSDR